MGKTAKNTLLPAGIFLMLWPAPAKITAGNDQRYCCYSQNHLNSGLTWNLSEFYPKDCKLSKFGYAMVLLNADVANPAAARWQLQVLEHFFAPPTPNS